MTLPKPSGQDPAIERLWARERVDDLLEQAELEPQRADKIRAEILGLALEHNLVTVYSSFVAIDQVDAVLGGKPRIIHVAQPLPQGLQPGAFAPGVQPMAMMASIMPQSPMLRQASAKFSGPARGLLSRGRAFLSNMTEADQADRVEDVAQPIPQVTAYPASLRQVQESSSTVDLKDREAVLRWLARTQMVNGSWSDSVEWTSAALLAFIRAGHTTRAGTYRQALRRALRYLVENTGEGQAQFYRARALAELAEATRDDFDRKAAQASRLVLPGPATVLEAAALGQGGQALTAISSLDDLRLAVMVRAALPVPPGLFSGTDGELARVWAAGIE
jgi:Ca-activated chloride channel family protein